MVLQEPGEIEAEFEQIGAETVLKEFFTYRNPGPLYLPKGKGFGHPPDAPIALPSWLSEEDIKYYTTKFEQKGFTGGINYYRNIDLYVIYIYIYVNNINLYLLVQIKEMVLTSVGDICRNWELTAAWTGVEIKVPVKFIVGDLDLTYNAPGTKEYIHNGGFKRDVPFLDEVVVMEGVGHFINEEKPDEVNKHIFDFFQKHF